jgi:import inner membrane translocase subunit TIM44
MFALCTVSFIFLIPSLRQVLDIDNIDLAMGKMMEQGPVLVITFNSQQILCVRDRTGKVIEGSPDKVS